MDQSLLKDWIADLRANGHLQGQGWFEYNGRYCCLGRLCVVAKQPTTTRGTIGNWTFIYNVIDSEAVVSRLYQMNDAGTPFAKIADWLEANMTERPR